MPLRIVRDDLVNLRADAIVLPSNEKLTIDGGAGYAVARRAGLFRLRRAVRKVGGCAVGSAVATPAFSFPARFLVHAVGPVWGATEEDVRLLRSAYDAALRVAEERGCKSVALPLLSAGTFGCPAHVSLAVALASIEEFLSTRDVEVTLVLFDKVALEAGLDFLGEIESRIDDAEVETRSRANWAAAAEELGSPEDTVQFTPIVVEEEVAPAPGYGYGEVSDGHGEVSDGYGEVSDGYSEAPGGGRDAMWLPGAGLGIAPDAGHDRAPGAMEAPDSAPMFDIRTGKQLEPDDGSSAWNDGPVFAAMPAPETQRPRPLEAGKRRRFPVLPSLGGRKAADADAEIKADDETAAFSAMPQADMQMVQRDGGFSAALDLESRLDQLDEGFSQTLLGLIDESGMTDAEVYRRANMSRQHFSKIRNNVGYRPSKPTVLALCIALELDLDQTRDLLERAGFALTHASKFDIIVEYFIERGIYSSFKINETLFYFDQQLLG